MGLISIEIHDMSHIDPGAMLHFRPAGQISNRTHE